MVRTYSTIKPCATPATYHEKSARDPAVLRRLRSERDHEANPRPTPDLVGCLDRYSGRRGADIRGLRPDPLAESCLRLTLVPSPRPAHREGVSEPIEPTDVRDGRRFKRDRLLRERLRAEFFADAEEDSRRRLGGA